MPELPEVETVKRGLEPVLTDRIIERVELGRAGLRFPFPEGFSRRLQGTKITMLSRRAKYILIHLDSNESLICHLGMTGRFTVLSDKTTDNLGAFYFETAATQSADGPHDHVVFHLSGKIRVVYSDPRRFGMMDLVTTPQIDQHRLLAKIGVEPLGNGLSPAYLVEKFAGRKAPLKAALLDQSIIAGLGNIYVCEALFRTRLLPTRLAGDVGLAKISELVRHIRDILNEAILAGGSTLQDFQHADGTKGAFQQRFLVYDRESEACQTCSTAIARMVQSGRSSFYCPTCQT